MNFKHIHEQGAGKKILFDDPTFFYFILPPIILSAGFTLKRRNFVANLGYILLFGIFGTVVSMVVLGCLIYLAGKYFVGEGFHFALPDALFLAIILCATDAVACVAIVKETDYPKLSSIMFGESVLNDAVSIILFQTVMDMCDVSDPTNPILTMTAASIFKGVGYFFYIFFASVLIGAGMALAVSAILKHMTSLKENHVFQVSLLLLFGYVAYVISEIAALSGIMTIFCSGFTMSHYAYYNISDKAKHATTIVFKTAGFMAEAFVFGYLGLVMCTLTEENVNIVFTVWVFFMSLIGRLGTIGIPMLIVYAIKRGDVPGITLRQLIMLWYSGLIKGAVAFALALILNVGEFAIVHSTTLIIVCFSTLVIGGLVPLFGKFVGIKPEGARKKSGSNIEQFLLNETESYTVPKKRGRFHQWWRNFDDKYIKVIFGGRPKIEDRVLQEDPFDITELVDQNPINIDSDQENTNSSADFHAFQSPREENKEETN